MRDVLANSPRTWFAWVMQCDPKRANDWNRQSMPAFFSVNHDMTDTTCFTLPSLNLYVLTTWGRALPRGHIERCDNLVSFNTTLQYWLEHQKLKATEPSHGSTPRHIPIPQKEVFIDIHLLMALWIPSSHVVGITNLVKDIYVYVKSISLYTTKNVVFYCV